MHFTIAIAKKLLGKCVNEFWLTNQGSFSILSFFIRLFSKNSKNKNDSFLLALKKKPFFVTNLCKKNPKKFTINGSLNVDFFLRGRAAIHRMKNIGSIVEKITTWHVLSYWKKASFDKLNILKDFLRIENSVMEEFFILYS